MCGRFAITLPHDAMVQLFKAAPANALPSVPNYNVCPTNEINVVRLGPMGRELVGMRWGFVPHWYKTPGDGPLLINARSDTIAEKPAYRTAVRERRCLVPTSGFYEWTVTEDKKKLPWYITRRDGAPLVMAAIWQDWTDGEGTRASVAIVTADATDEMAAIHHRTPVILEPEDQALWLGESGKGAATLMHGAPPGALSLVRVSPAVNSNRASGAGLIAPLSEGEL